MIIDPVKTELAIRQDLDEAKKLLVQRTQLIANIDQEIENLKQQKIAFEADVKRIESHIAKWESFIAPDPVPGDENTENDTDVCHD